MTFFSNRLATVFSGNQQKQVSLSQWLAAQPDIRFSIKDAYREGDNGVEVRRISKIVIRRTWPDGKGNSVTVLDYDGQWNLQPHFFELHKRLALWLVVKAFGTTR